MSSNTFLATVTASAPEFGFAFIVRADGSGKGKAGCLGFLPLSESRFGACHKWAPTPGEAVVCMEDPRTPMCAFILCPANESLHDSGESNGGRRFHMADSFTGTDSDAQLDVFTKLTEYYQQWLGNRGNGTDRDQYPGDFIIGDNQGMAGLLVGRYLSQIRGSSMAYLEATGVGNRVIAVGETLEAHTLLTEQASDKGLRVSNVAMNFGESLGFLRGTQALEEDASAGKALKRKDDDALPLFRLQSVEGEAAAGSEKLVLGLPRDDVHTSDTEPPVLARQRTSTTGELSSASVLGLLSVKAPWIPALHQRGYGGVPDSEYAYDDFNCPSLRTPYTGTPGKPYGDTRVSDPEEDAARTLDEPLNKLMDLMLSDDYVTALLEKLNARGLKLAARESSIFGEEAPSVPGGSCEKQQYDLPKSFVDIENPETGRTRRYYGNASFISQEPDGDILIADGYGSEIRMSRGNIYISPALDLILRPGRDLSAMTGRHTSFNSQDTVTINTTTGMYLRADGDLKIAGAMASGTDREGAERNSSRYTVTLQSGAKSGGTGGMVIRSDSNLSVTGQDLYIGRNAHSGKSEEAATEPDKSGGIVIDAGTKGVMYLQSSAMFSKSREHTIVSDTGSQASALVVGGSYIGQYTQSVLCPADLRMVPLEKPMTIKIPVDGISKDLYINTKSKPEPAVNADGTVSGGQAPSCYLLVYGTCVLNESLKINGNCIVNKTLAGKHVISTSRLMGRVRSSSSTWDEYEVSMSQINASLSGNGVVTTVTSYLAKKLYSDSYLAVHGFCFPEYKLGYVPRVPGMLWQVYGERKDISVEAGSQAHWKEYYVQDSDGRDTAAYPGISAWENAQISIIGLETRSLKDFYVINVPGDVAVSASENTASKNSQEN